MGASEVDGCGEAAGGGPDVARGTVGATGEDGWEVAWNPGFTLAPDGSIVLPDFG